MGEQVQHNADLKRVAYFAVVLVAFFGFMVTPIWDSDFWWHIASGRWIVEHGRLPTSDPFGVYVSSDTVRNDTVLRGQWLGQVLLYFMHAWFDTLGVILLRAALITTCLTLLIWRAWRLGAAQWATWVVFIPSGLIALGFTSDRPQLFSYLFATLLFLCVERYQQTGLRRWLIALPLIAVAWANTHGAFLLAVALLAIYTTAAWLTTRLNKGTLDAKQVWLAAAAITFAMATLLNPNGLTTYLYLLDLEGSALQQATSEYRSAFVIYQLGYVVPQIWVVTIYALTLLAGVGLYKVNRAQLSVVIFLCVISAWSYRYFAFLVFIAGPYISIGLTQIFKSFAAQRVERYGAPLIAILSALLLLVGVSKGWALRTGVSEKMFPRVATEVLKKLDITGKVFNHMQWGGYLLWHLTPRAQIYIDGRMLDRALFPPYTNILWATPPGIDRFEREHFNTVIIPLTNRFTGERYPLNDYLLKQADWRVSYRDDAMYIFTRAAH